MNTFKSIQQQLGISNHLSKLIFINAAVFLFIKLGQTIIFLFNTYSWIDWFILYTALPSDFNSLLSRPWTFISYMFVHEGIWHFVFNMLVLYWTGKIFNEYLGSTKLVTTYINGALLGGLLYVITYNVFPAFTEQKEYSTLIGASAGILAILVAIATLIPDYKVFLLLFGAVAIKYIALVAVLIYLILIPSGNAGGNIAHIGGALYGFLFVKQMRSGRNLGAWLEFIFDRLSRTGKKSKLKVVKSNASDYNTQTRIDKILEKISQSGYDSLSEEEKELLFRMSNRK
ncbi:MAG TPA: rhomboid family intramembrane serine protease [Bacteroidia bacterium]|nr:rhomboid family intramembrane serine protease [Bacteroidia bacterium]HNT80136.1 rhomboid family intramembrane serine protease [Bacteroidia bacterium]